MPEELHSPVKVGKNIYFFDLVFIVSWIMVFTVIGQGMVKQEFNMFYMFWNGIVAIMLTRPALGNPEKRMYYSFLFYLMRDRKVYHPVDLERRRHDYTFAQITKEKRKQAIK